MNGAVVELGLGTEIRVDHLANGRGAVCDADRQRLIRHANTYIWAEVDLET